jgi:hypothetical protein
MLKWPEAEKGSAGAERLWRDKAEKERDSEHFGIEEHNFCALTTLLGRVFFDNLIGYCETQVKMRDGRGVGRKAKV